MITTIATLLLIAAMPLTTKSSDCPPVAYVPAAGVEYQAGVDAKGWMVAPAELTPPVLTQEDFRRIPIPLNIPLENYLADQPDAATKTYNVDTSQSWVQPGLVTVDAVTGQAQWNGKPLNAPATDCNQ